MKNNSLQKQTRSKQALALTNDTSTGKDYLVKWNPQALTLEYRGVKSASDAIACTDVELRHIEEAYGMDTLSLMIKTNIASLQSYLNVKDEMRLGIECVTELTMYIIEDFKHFNIAEFTLVFKNIKKAAYGPIYGRIDPNMILNCFRTYDEVERVDAFRRQKQSEDIPKYKFTPEYYAAAKSYLLKQKEIENEDMLTAHLKEWKGFVCQKCRELKVRDCKESARLLINENPNNSYAVATWLLCWEK